MSLKTERVIYTSKNFETGLADITANIRRNGVSVATGVALSEVALGRYELVLSPATLTGYGGAGYYDFYINSASKSAPAVAARWILGNDSDDLEAHLTTIEGKIDIVDGNVDAIKADVQSGSYGLSAIKNLIDTLQSSVNNIQNTTRFVAAVPSQMIRPDSGTTRYRIPILIYDTSGNLEDPDSNQVTVSIKDEAGNNRNDYLVGSVASAPVDATRVGVGDYYIDVDIPSAAGLEQLNFAFDYVENSIALKTARTTLVVQDVQAAGFALESTAQAILTDTADMQPRVSDIQTKINDATYGLAALKVLLDTIAGYTDGVEPLLENGTYGLAALKAILDTKSSQASVDAVQADTTAIKGSGFATGTDSLKAISDRTYFGGYSV